MVESWRVGATPGSWLLLRKCWCKSEQLQPLLAENGASVQAAQKKMKAFVFGIQNRDGFALA